MWRLLTQSMGSVWGGTALRLLCAEARWCEPAGLNGLGGSMRRHPARACAEQIAQPDATGVPKRLTDKKPGHGPSAKAFRCHHERLPAQGRKSGNDDLAAIIH